MNESNNTQYALHADPGKPLRDAQAEIASLKKQIDTMRAMHTKDVDYVNALLNQMGIERDIYRSLVYKVMKINAD